MAPIASFSGMAMRAIAIVLACSPAVVMSDCTLELPNEHMKFDSCTKGDVLPEGGECWLGCEAGAPPYVARQLPEGQHVAGYAHFKCISDTLVPWCEADAATASTASTASERWFLDTPGGVHVPVRTCVKGRGLFTVTV